MNELLIAILFLTFGFVIIPFIIYCIVVFMDRFDNIYYMRDYVYNLKHHYLKETFTIPILNFFVSICFIFLIIIGIVSNIIEIIWKHIPKISIFENKCINIWDRFSNWFMNIKIK
jgi:hypothetical protein